MSSMSRATSCRIDRARYVDLEAGARASILLAADGDELRIGGDRVGYSAWLVLRGRMTVHSREGEFHLRSREWLMLEGDAGPCGRVGPNGIAIVIRLAREEAGRHGADDTGNALFSGCGSLMPGMRLEALRLWRTCHAMGLEARASALLARMQHHQAEVVERCPGRSLGRRRQIFARLQRARLYMQGHAGMCARIGELARWSHFSPWYFSKLFQSVYGLAPQQYAARLRLDQARRLLVEGRLPVTEVSLASGFESPCSFARAFRARYGVSASEYRLMHARSIHAGGRS